MSFFLKKIVPILIFAYAMGILAACFDNGSNNEKNSSGAQPAEKELDFPDLLLVKSNGKSTYLGTDSSSAKASERPKMKVSFDYNYYIGVHEVTCGEFNKLMKKATGLSDDCKNDSLPIVNVTYYDAILYANARSKEEGFDTIYTYSKASFDENKNCIELEKLNFLNDVEGFRLPTEAEWVYAASLEWKPSKSWHNGNSDFERHIVCSKKEGKNFCDFAGNVKEWVNDWQGTLSATPVSNYMGAPYGNDEGERVLKGGSFSNELKAINLYSRGDVYTVTSTSQAKHVGFRIAFGKIDRGTWIDNKGTASESRIFARTSVSEMFRLFGTYSTKIAFRNDVNGNIAFINFRGGSAAVDEIQDTLDCYHPEISPDGKMVAFSTKYEGISGKSSLYVRRLATANNKPVRLEVESAAIPRWQVEENGDTVIIYVSDAGIKKIEDAFKEASTWKVKYSGGSFGTPQKIFDGNYHGGVSVDGKFAVTGAQLLRVNQNGKDSIWYDGRQACNVSYAKESKQTLFLDFGSKAEQSFTGKRYGVHEQILIANENGKIIQSFASPAGYSFDHSEWNVGSGPARKIVATLNNVNGVHSKIVLVDPQDSSVIELVEGEELWHPCLWVGDVVSFENVTLDTDSAGVYLTEGGKWPNELMRIKMDMFWHKRDSIEILAVGSSRMEDGISPKEIKSGFCLNMGHPDNDMNASLYIARNYGFNHLPKLKTIVVSLDFDLWRIKNDYSDALFNTPGYIYDANHNFWKDSIPEGFLDAVAGSYPASPGITEYYASTLGSSLNPSVEWGEPLVETDSSWAETDESIIPWQVNLLEKFLDDAADIGVTVVGVIFPQNPKYANTGSWGRYGPSRSAATGIMKTLSKLEQKYDNFIIMDENKMGSHDYDNSKALNTDHLSQAGNIQISKRLDTLLMNLYKKAH